MIPELQDIVEVQLSSPNQLKHGTLSNQLSHGASRNQLKHGSVLNQLSRGSSRNQLQHGACALWKTSDNVRGISLRLQSICTETDDVEKILRQLAEFVGRMSPQILMRVQFSSAMSHGEHLPMSSPRLRAIKKWGMRESELLVSFELDTKALSFSKIIDFLSFKNSLKNKISSIGSGASIGKKEALASDFRNVDPNNELLMETVRDFLSLGLKYEFLSKEEIKAQFPKNPKSWALYGEAIDIGEKFVGTLRVTPAPNELNSDQNFANGEDGSGIKGAKLPKLLSLIPAPYSFSVTMKRMRESEEEILLSKKTKEMKDEALADQSLGLRLARSSGLSDRIHEFRASGEHAVKLEMIVMIPRDDVGNLKRDLREAQKVLSQSFRCEIETYGVLPSFSAIYPGASQHVPFLESSHVVPRILPMFEEGVSMTVNKSNRCETQKSRCETQSNRCETQKGLLVHRKSEAVCQIDLFDPKMLNSNLLIVGRSGRGKSAFLGMLTESLLNQPNYEIIKVDVGGSHRNEVELFGGRHFEIKMSEPSGLCPLKGLEANAMEEVPEHVRFSLTNFIEALVLEEGQMRLTKNDRVHVDEWVTKYLTETSGPKSLTGFYEFSKSGFSRSRLLSRFAKGGIYEKVFRKEKACLDSHEKVYLDIKEKARLDNRISRTRLSYYNLSEIFEARDEDLSRAIISAVLTEFNLKLLSKGLNERLILIFDETPFFIKSSFDFFKFTAANVRKFGGSLILSAQVSSDFVVMGDKGTEDRGVVDNSYQRVLFSVDGKREEFQSLFQLPSEALFAVEGLETKKGEYSEFYYQYGNSGFVGRLRLHPEELLRVSTSPEDQEKVRLIKEHIPMLSLEEAIQCLAINIT